MSPCKCQFLQRGYKKSINDDFYFAKLDNKVVCWMLVAPFRPLYNTDSHLSFSSIPVIHPVSNSNF